MDEPKCPDGLQQACTRVEAVMSQLAFCSSITADRAATRIVNDQRRTVFGSTGAPIEIPLATFGE